MGNFVSGMATAGYLIAGLFFLRFWSRGRDLFFLAFAGAFLLLALSQALLSVRSFPESEQTLFYILRLAAFTLILLAIVYKNARRTP